MKPAAPFTSSDSFAARSVLAALLPWAVVGALLLTATGCFAQTAHHPFAVGANEGAAGGVEGFSGWLLGMESGFFRLLTGALRAAKQSSASAWSLIGLSLAYGVFHAAGPGHGKAVIASYMLANESVLRRGLVISLAAALLQGLVAIAIVGIAALVLGATAKRMTAAANMVEILGYAGIVVLGAVLVVTKGAALRAAWRAAPFETLEFAPSSLRPAPAGGGLSARFSAEDCSAGHAHSANCGHFHAPDPRTLGSGFAWKTAALTVLAAGARPCSGAILVLVFAAAQGIFLAGIGAVAAMSLGSAATTGALATLAVLAKKTAAKYSKAGAWRTLVVGRLFEVGAALAVLLFGLALLIAALYGARLTS